MASRLGKLDISEAAVKNKKYQNIDHEADKIDDVVELVVSSEGVNPGDVFVK